ncbi:IclR family transcriptional regulator [Ruegeria sp. EL01]|uniref:IclR family transcriptional regulator n=1 Tax=Ruegeria sp. EL01 TaxID=2107578 RepID=UPI000EA82336|nr:IclR family transcriptional regulator [Ruegeria sp. EL01]
MAQKPVKYSAPALEKGLEILELLASQQGALTQIEVARALERSQSEIYRVLTTLVRLGYVSRSENGDRYSLSLKLFSTSRRHAPIGRMLDFAVPRMRQAAKLTFQSCHIGLESNADIVVVSTATAPGNWGLALRTGSVIGLWNTGTGRVLAAFRDDVEVRDLVEMHRPAIGEPPVDFPVLQSELQEIRKNGFYKAKSDTIKGITNLSFPVFDPQGRVVAALSSPFLQRVDDLETRSLKEVQQVFSDLAQELTSFYSGDYTEKE